MGITIRGDDQTDTENETDRNTENTNGADNTETDTDTDTENKTGATKSTGTWPTYMSTARRNTVSTKRGELRICSSASRLRVNQQI